MCKSGLSPVQKTSNQIMWKWKSFTSGYFNKWNFIITTIVNKKAILIKIVTNNKIFYGFIIRICIGKIKLGVLIIYHNYFTYFFLLLINLTTFSYPLSLFSHTKLKIYLNEFGENDRKFPERKI